ncbi:gnt1 [Symbiodinium microadriaticum]|nr:gnt1 [Symbiodinium microadriaticum]
MASRRETIFVSIASYRDTQCQYTIQDLFQKAKHPDRVVAGVCFQVAPSDSDSFLLDLGTWSARIRTYFLHHTEARGPCYARALIQQELFRNEDFYFQIDSHMRFVQDWDVLCLEQLACCKSQKPILTTYAGSYTLPKHYVPGMPDCAELAPCRAVPILCADTFGDAQKDDPFLRIKTRQCRTDFRKKPPPSLFWTARFAFSRGDVVKDVPYDPHLEYVFFGEEIGMSARLWTAGWDFFHPTQELAYHLGSRAHRYWFREVQTTPEQIARETRAKHRLCGLLGTFWKETLHAPPARPYDLGTKRSLLEYQGFAGVDFAAQRVLDHGHLGGQPADAFAPLWAEAERDQIMLSNQLKDVESWAGKGSKGASTAEAAAAMTAKAPQASSQAVEQAKDLARLRIHSLRAQGEGPTTNLELARAFAELGQLEESSGNGRAAAAALEQGLGHLSTAKEELPLEKPEIFEASVASTEASLRISLQEFPAAKALLKGAVKSSVAALEKHGLEALHVAHATIDAIHTSHERTDDRKGLQSYHHSFEALLQALWKLVGDEPSEVPRLTAAQPPPEDGSEPELARLLHRLVLVCVATGREKDMALVKTVFQRFRMARESPALLRLLAMLQSAGKGGWGAPPMDLMVKGGGDYGKGYGKQEPQAPQAPKEAKGLLRTLLSNEAIPGGKWNNDDNTLFVGGLPEDMTNLEMYQIFAPFGPIAPRGATALLDKETGKCTGIGFVNFMEKDAAERAIRVLNSFPFLDGSWLTVKKKGPPKSKGEGKGDEKGSGKPSKGEKGKGSKS